MGDSNKCPYRGICGIKYECLLYCSVAKHLKCIEYQVLRDKENKNREKEKRS